MTKAREIRLNSKASFGLNYELIEDVFFPTPYFDLYVWPVAEPFWTLFVASWTQVMAHSLEKDDSHDD